jgi:hypothetical protein
MQKSVKTPSPVSPCAYLRRLVRTGSQWVECGVACGVRHSPFHHLCISLYIRTSMSIIVTRICDANPRRLTAKWDGFEIGAFWGAMSTHSALGGIPVRGGWRNWHARKSALRHHKIADGGTSVAVVVAARWCEIGAFWGAMSTHSVLGGIPVRGRRVVVCDWNQYQYGIVY